MKTRQFSSLCYLVLVLWGCNNPQSADIKDTPVSGNISIGVDESLSPFIAAEAEAFEATYPNASLNINNYSEAMAFQQFMADSVQTIVVTRKLTAEEDALLNEQNYFSKYTKVAHDALVMIVHPEHKLSAMDTIQWCALLSGEDTEYPLVFDSENSGSLEMLRKLYLSSDSLPVNFKAAKNTPDLVAYITSDTNAIGLVGRSWISEKHDSLTTNFLKEVKILSLQGSDGLYYQPYQAYIAQKSYPLTREVFMITREAYTGLGSGFVAYVAGDKGQLVALKSGLVPATMPVRLVQFSEKNSNK